MEAQVAALNGIDTAEAKSQKARLEAELSEKKEDLEDTVNEHVFELSQDALSELKDILQEEFDDKWNHINANLEDIKEIMDAANQLTAAQTSVVQRTLNELLSYYGINPTTSGLETYTGYASGVRNVDKDKVAWTQEDGREMIIRKSDGAILTPLSQGDSVIPNDMTENLFEWGKMNPNMFNWGSSTTTPPPAETKGDVNVSYGSLINVEGNVDKNIMPTLEDIVKETYGYMLKEIPKDARKLGLKR